MKLDAQTKAGLHGKPPSLTPIFAGTFGRFQNTAAGAQPRTASGAQPPVQEMDYNASAKRFYAMYGFEDVNMTASGGTSHGINVVSLGDEIVS